MDRRLLTRLASEVDEEHNDTMASLADSFAEQAAPSDERTVNARRAFITRLGAGAAIGTALVFTAARPAAASAEGKAATPSDQEFLGWAQSLELAAVAAYDIAIKSGKLSAPVMSVAATFRAHHLDHAEAASAASAKFAKSVANATVVAQLGPAFTNARSEADLLTAAYELENIAAATYLTAIGKISGSSPAALIASILPIEARHATVLGRVLDLETKDYLPVIEPTESALTPADYPIGG